MVCSRESPREHPTGSFWYSGDPSPGRFRMRSRGIDDARKGKDGGGCGGMGGHSGERRTYSAFRWVPLRWAGRDTGRWASVARPTLLRDVWVQTGVPVGIAREPEIGTRTSRGGQGGQGTHAISCSRSRLAMREALFAT